MTSNLAETFNYINQSFRAKLRGIKYAFRSLKYCKKEQSGSIMMGYVTRKISNFRAKNCSTYLNVSFRRQSSRHNFFVNFLYWQTVAQRFPDLKAHFSRSIHTWELLSSLWLNIVWRHQNSRLDEVVRRCRRLLRFSTASLWRSTLSNCLYPALHVFVARDFYIMYHFLFICDLCGEVYCCCCFLNGYNELGPH